MERRKAVLGPGELDPLGPYSDLVEQRSGISAREPINQALFRQYERKFKKFLPKPHNLFSIKLICGKSMTDLELKDEFNVNISYHTVLNCKSLRVITVPDLPGLIYVPMMLSKELQLELLIKTLKEGMIPKYSSNLDSIFKEKGPFSVPTSPIVLNQIPQVGLYSKILEDKWENSSTAISLFRRYRWVALGIQYNWSTKEYLWDTPQHTIPPLIEKTSIDICTMLLGDKGKSYKPQAGIINYYQPGDTLTGHVDRSELDDRSPLLSMSLGLDAIFLVGGATRNDKVIPFRLSSGDVIILMDECRRFYHGVPLIIPESLPDYLKSSSATLEEEEEELVVALKLINNARININIRQVWPG